MASPNTSPIKMIGMKETNGDGSIRPKVPSWKISTVAPSVARTESRNPNVAVSGTRIDRKTSISKTKANPITTAR